MVWTRGLCCSGNEETGEEDEGSYVDGQEMKMRIGSDSRCSEMSRGGEVEVGLVSLWPARCRTARVDFAAMDHHQAWAGWAGIGRESHQVVRRRRRAGCRKLRSNLPRPELWLLTLLSCNCLAQAGNRLQQCRGVEDERSDSKDLVQRRSRDFERVPPWDF